MTSFDDVRKAVRRLILDDIRDYEIVCDTNECFQVNFMWGRCLGELIVNHPDFAPYRFVTFHIISSNTERLKDIYYFNDSEEDSLEIILEKIKDGILKGKMY